MITADARGQLIVAMWWQWQMTSHIVRREMQRHRKQMQRAVFDEIDKWQMTNDKWQMTKRQDHSCAANRIKKAGWKPDDDDDDNEVDDDYDDDDNGNDAFKVHWLRFICSICWLIENVDAIFHVSDLTLWVWWMKRGSINGCICRHLFPSFDFLLSAFYLLLLLSPSMFCTLYSLYSTFHKASGVIWIPLMKVQRFVLIANWQNNLSPEIYLITYITNYWP